MTVFQGHHLTIANIPKVDALVPTRKTCSCQLPGSPYQLGERTTDGEKAIHSH